MAGQHSASAMSQVQTLCHSIWVRSDSYYSILYLAAQSGGLISYIGSNECTILSLRLEVFISNTNNHNSVYCSSTSNSDDSGLRKTAAEVDDFICTGVSRPSSEGAGERQMQDLGGSNSPSCLCTYCSWSRSSQIAIRRISAPRNFTPCVMGRSCDSQNCNILADEQTVIVLDLALTRPRTCPTALLTYYASVFLVEMASIIDGQVYPPLKIATHYFAGSVAILSFAVILSMPIRPLSLPSSSISSVGSIPNDSLRSPEDNLRLWQFLCISWMNPLIALGKKRKLNEEDVWLLPFQYQQERLYEAFRQLRGSVLTRLLRANGVDCCVVIFLAFVQLICRMCPISSHR